MQNKDGRAVVQLTDVETKKRKQFTLGPWGTDEAEIAYYDLLARFRKARRRLSEFAEPQGATEPGISRGPTVDAVLDNFQKHKKTSKDAGEHCRAIRTVLPNFYGHMPAVSFDAFHFQELVDDHFLTQTNQSGQLLARETVVKRISVIKRAFRIAHIQGQVGATVLTSLEAVKLEDGEGRYSQRLSRLPKGVVRRTWRQLRRHQKAMVLLQMISGMRVQELCDLTPGQIDRSDPDCWIYEPDKHKMKRKGLTRRVPLGPRSIRVLAPFMLRPDDKPCFSPDEAWKESLRLRSEQRVTPENTGNAVGRKNGQRTEKIDRSDQYTPSTYRQTIYRACERAGVEYWWPRRLRHTALDRIEKIVGLTAASKIADHTDETTTRRKYVIESEKLKIQTAKQVG